MGGANALGAGVVAGCNLLHIKSFRRGTHIGNAVISSSCNCATIGSFLRQTSTLRTSSLISQPKPVSCTATESGEAAVSRRQCIFSALLCSTAVLTGHLQGSSSALAEEKEAPAEGGTFVDGVLSLFDPDQVTKSGKKLPKKYVKSVKEVVKSLRESFSEDASNNAKFRRNADSAKEAIREYLQDWRGSKVVATEDSYIALERAFRVLGQFYTSKGPQAALPEDIRNRVLEDLNKADDSL